MSKSPGEFHENPSSLKESQKRLVITLQPPRKPFQPQIVSKLSHKNPSSLKESPKYLIKTLPTPSFDPLGNPSNLEESRKHLVITLKPSQKPFQPQRILKTPRDYLLSPSKTLPTSDSLESILRKPCQPQRIPKASRDYPLTL